MTAPSSSAVPCPARTSAPTRPESPAACPAGAPAHPARAAPTALAPHPPLARSALKAHIVGGRLVLTGRVRTGAEKDLAGVVARDAASAAVENNVIVQP